MPIDLSKLDPEQRQAVTAADGTTIVFAGAGTGKTRTLTARFAWLIEQGVAPGAIMAVTFTRRASEEMRTRIAKLLGDSVEDPKRLRIGTFHALMARELRFRAGAEGLARVGRSERFTVYDEDDRERLLGRLVKELGLGFTAGALGREISLRKNDGEHPDDGAVPLAVREPWRRYEEALRAADAMDFDDLLGVPVSILDADPELRERWSSSIRHLLIDEFQDTNAIQLRLVDLLASVHGNIFCVGDDAQSIYRFRGAKLENLTAFRNRHGESLEISLTRNYRSTRAILEVANRVLANNTENVKKRLVPAGNPGAVDLPRALLTRDEAAEADLIARSIRRASGGGFPLGEIAVLVRTKSQTRALETAFAAGGIAYRLLGATAFWSRKEVRDLVAWLRTIRSERDELAYVRALGAPARGIGDRLIDAARPRAAAIGWPAALAEAAAGKEGTAKGRAELRSWLDLRASWAGRLAVARPGALAAEILESSGLADSLGEGEEAQERRANLREVVAAAAPYEAGQMEAFLETAALDDARVAAEGHDPRRSVVLATLHATKGLEWAVVFLAGCEEGLLPHQNARLPGDIEEERRLFYVGVTRARSQLILTAAARRRIGGGWADQRPSRFLGEAGPTIKTERLGFRDQE